MCRPETSEPGRSRTYGVPYLGKATVWDRSGEEMRTVSSPFAAAGARTADQTDGASSAATDTQDAASASANRADLQNAMPAMCGVPLPQGFSSRDSR